MVRPATGHRPSPFVLPVLALAALGTGLVQAWRVMVLPDAARFNFDAAEYALAGRAWLETGRLVTPFVHPATVGAVPGPPWPLLAGHPLVPALDALAFAVFGAHPDATIVPALLAFVLATLCVARLAWGFTQSSAAMLGAGLVFAVSPWALSFATMGLSEMPFAALLAAAFLLLWEFPDRPRPWLLGAVLGLAHLTRPVLVPMLPALLLGLVLLAPSGKRLGMLVRTLAVFLPLASLTFLYKVATTHGASHEPGGYLLLNGAAPEFVVSRLNRMFTPPDAMAWLAAHPDLFLAKVLRNVRSLLYGLWTLSGRWPFPLALVALAHAIRSTTPKVRAFGLTVLAAALLLLGLDAATVADPRLMFPLLPLVMALAVAGLTRLTESLGSGRRWVVQVVLALALLVTLRPTLQAWRSPDREGLRERDWRSIGLAVRAMLPERVLIASDAAPWIAWTTGLPATLVPLTPADLATMPANLSPDAVVLTDEWLVHRPGEEAWRAMLENGTAPTGWLCVGRAHTDRLRAAVFLRDRTHL